MCMMKTTNNTLEKLMTYVLITIQIRQMKTLQIKNYNLNIKCVIKLTKNFQMSLPCLTPFAPCFSTI
jgi:hypothetical protein